MVLMSQDSMTPMVHSSAWRDGGFQVLGVNELLMTGPGAAAEKGWNWSTFTLAGMLLSVPPPPARKGRSGSGLVLTVVVGSSCGLRIRVALHLMAGAGRG